MAKCNVAAFSAVVEVSSRLSREFERAPCDFCSADWNKQLFMITRLLDGSLRLYRHSKCFADGRIRFLAFCDSIKNFDVGGVQRTALLIKSRFDLRHTRRSQSTQDARN